MAMCASVWKLMCFDCYAEASGKKEEKEAEKAMETKQDMNHLFFSTFFMLPNTSMVAVARFPSGAEERYQQQWGWEAQAQAWRNSFLAFLAEFFHFWLLTLKFHFRL